VVISWWKLILFGGGIGVANIIPGVSGGTMAVVFGIYEKLINIIGTYFTDLKNIRPNSVFIFFLAAGAASAIIALSWVMDFLLLNYAIYTYIFFCGLIAGSVPSVYKNHSDMKIDFNDIGLFLLAILIMYIFTFVPKPASEAADLSLAGTTSIPLLLLSGIVAGGAMIVPGISGSLMLVVMNQYINIIRAIKHFDFAILSIFSIGVGLGILLFSKLISYLLNRFPRLTMFFLLGLVAGSLIPIFPGFASSTGGNMLLLLFLGLGLVSALEMEKINPSTN
jgi:putative membrane protein